MLPGVPHGTDTPPTSRSNGKQISKHARLSMNWSAQAGCAPRFSPDAEGEAGAATSNSPLAPNRPSASCNASCFESFSRRRASRL